MPETLDTVLLLALPASGKSEVRRYLDLLAPEECRRDFHMGQTAQLDDFPYVHLMRRIDDELEALGQARIFFQTAAKPFIDTKDWGTLIHLINEDHRDMLAKKIAKPASVAMHLLERIDRAAARTGLAKRLEQLAPKTREAICAKIEQEAAAQLADKQAAYPDSLDGKTLVIEFARGGPQDSAMPLPKEYGYRYSLSQLSDEILSRSTILYIWVTPEESRRKNDARADPDDPGSILHHGVPIDVILGDYGCDDLDWLEQQSDRPGTIRVEANEKTYHLPVARFDNRVDKTSFIRNERSDWKPAEVEAIHQGLKGALDKLIAQYRQTR
jgi:hypothetical protein